MKWLHPSMFRHAGLFSGLTVAAALSLGLAAPAHASKAISASFDPSTGILTVKGDAAHNTITISRKTSGTIRINGGAVSVQGGKPSATNTSLIEVFGEGGNDTISFDEANGALPQAKVYGSSGNDTLAGGSGNDQLFGQSGNDTLLGKGGNDLLFGGEGDDVLTGGDGDDQAVGESGNDRMVWNAGDDTDFNEGGDGSDTVEANGANATENFTATANGARVRFDQSSPAASFLDIGSAEKLVLNAKGGDDTFSATGNLAALIQIAVDGGAGKDTLLGSNGVDTLSGGDGNDTVDGQQGNDVALLGAGDDVFQWDPGDGNDTVEGQAGNDTLRFNGSNAGEAFDAAANGERLRFTRNVASIVMDINDVETVDVNALGGADSLTINDLTGTDVAKLHVNLAATLNGTTGDAQPDQIIARGTAGNDAVEVAGSGTSFTVGGLRSLVAVTNAEGANDSLVVESLAGNDVVNASTLGASVVKLVTEGGVGGDTLRFNGSAASEEIGIGGNAGRIYFGRGAAAIPMDLNDVETVDVDAGGGADTVFVGDVSGTELTAVKLNLAAAGDDPDSVTVNGTNGFDVIKVDGSAGAGIAVTGLPATVNIKTLNGADALTVNALEGADQVNASALAANTIAFAANGGLGVDNILGSQGNDVVSGGDGDDLAMMGGGADTFVWNPGDDNDVVEGEDGDDTLRFNGAMASEKIDIAANGQRVRFSRDLAVVTADLTDVETVDFNALGGTDLVFVGDMSGTDLRAVNINLAAGGGGGDAQLDSVFVNGSNGDDEIVASGDWNGTTVLGLAAKVNIVGAEMDNDGLIISTLDGDDTLDASGLANGAMQLTAYGGDDDDELIGGDNADVLSGEDGDDVLRGGPGVDVLDGGPGENVVTQD